MAITARNLSEYRKVWAGGDKPGKTYRHREKPLVEPGLPGRSGKRSLDAGKVGQRHPSSCLQGAGK